jgi:hypothetical protein
VQIFFVISIGLKNKLACLSVLGILKHFIFVKKAWSYQKKNNY